MSIPIIDPMLPSGPAPDPNTNPAPVAPPTSTADTLSSANDLPELDMVSFSRILGDAKVNLQDTQYETIQFNANNRNELYASLTLESLTFIQKLIKLTELVAKYSFVYDANTTDVTNFNNVANIYNSSVYPNDTSAINAINSAISDYNSGSISVADYNTAVNTWNSYVNSRNANSNYTNFSNGVTTYNNNVAATNTQIADINATLTTVGIGNVPSQLSYTGSSNTLSTLSLSPPIPVTAVSNVSFVIPQINFLQPPAVISVLVTNYLSILIKSLSATQYLTQKILMSQSDYQAFLQFKLLGSVTTLPESITTPIPAPNATGTSTSTSSGSGVGIASIVSSLDNPLASAAISQALYEGYLTASSSIDPVQLLQQFSALNLLILSTIGLSAGASLPGILSGAATTNDLLSSPITVAVGAAIASEIIVAIQNGVVGSSVLDILKNAFPDASVEALTNLAAQIATGSELILLLLGLAQLGQVLNNPELLGQVIATLNAEDDLGVTAPSTSTTADVVLADTTTLNNLKSTLTASLATQENISQSAAADIINSAVNTALQNQTEIANGNLGQQLSAALINSNVQQSDATALGELAQSYIQAEISSGNILNQSLSQTDLNQSLLSNSYIQTLLQNENITNVRQLRDSLATELAKSEGVTQSQALEAANVAVTGQPAPVNAVSVEDLRTQLLSEATTKLEALGQTNAAQIAQQIVNTVIGNGEDATDRVSLANLIDERLQTIVSSNDLQLTQAAKDSLNTLLANTTDLWALGNWIRDPANTLLQVTGLDRTVEPSNFKANIDVRI